MLFKSKSRLIRGGFSFAFVYTFILNVAFGAITNNQISEEIRDFFGVKNYTITAIEHSNSDVACIGDSFSDCGVWTNNKIGDLSKKHGTKTDAGAILVLMARKVNANGAEFCVTQLEASNDDYKQHWAWFNCHKDVDEKARTEYFESASGSKCFWLCRDGFSGTECRNSTQASSCNTTTMNKNQFSGFKMVTKAAQNIEDLLPMFHMNQEKNKEEYDMILAVTKWAPGGHGAFVSPVVVRAKLAYTSTETGCSCCNKYYNSAPHLKKVGKEHLLCLDGYSPNSNGTDCVVLSKGCAVQNACSGYSDYVQTQHTKVINGNCYEFRCVGDKGFASSTSHSCVECTGETGRFGIANNGVCIKCPAGTVFDGEDAASGYCPRAVAYSPNVLEFGINGSAGDSISDQCWTFTDLDLYKECVQNGSAAAKKKLEEKRAN